MPPKDIADAKFAIALGVDYLAQPYRVGSQDCRQYTHTVTIDGARQTARGTACRNPDVPGSALSLSSAGAIAGQTIRLTRDVRRRQRGNA